MAGKYKVYDVIEEDISLDDPPLVAKKDSQQPTHVAPVAAPAVVTKKDEKTHNNAVNKAPTKYKEYDVIEEDISLDDPPVIIKKAPVKHAVPSIAPTVFQGTAAIQKKDDSIQVSNNSTTMSGKLVNKAPKVSNIKCKTYEVIEEDIDLDAPPAVIKNTLHSNASNTPPKPVSRWDDIHKDRSAMLRPENKNNNIYRDNKLPHPKVVDTKSSEPRRAPVRTSNHPNGATNAASVAQVTATISNISLDKDNKLPQSVVSTNLTKVTHAVPSAQIANTPVVSKRINTSSGFRCQTCKTGFISVDCNCSDYPCCHVQNCEGCRGGVATINSPSLRKTVVKKRQGWDEDDDSD